MTSLTLKDISGNAFRILGLTADASQAQIDSAARRMRIYQDPEMIPASHNDAPWIGPVPRTPQDIENAVARLADPLMRLQERFWWFCGTPPDSDAPISSNPTDVTGSHEAALIELYRSLLVGSATSQPDAWQMMTERFQLLVGSDAYLQWLSEVESAGDFEKRASLEEIVQAQRQLPGRLSTAVVESIDDALADGDYAAAVQAVQLARVDGDASPAPDHVETLIDRIEDDLAARCDELSQRIDDAWRTQLVSSLRPACNHAMSRFSTVVRPLIDQLLSATHDVDRQNRARMLGVKFLIHVSEAYRAIDNHLAAQRTLGIAMEVAANTPMAAVVANLQDKVTPAARRQRAGAPSGQRDQPSDKPAFKTKPGGKVREESWLGVLRAEYLWWLLIPFLLMVVRVGCGSSPAAAPDPGLIPRYDASHPPSAR